MTKQELSVVRLVSSGMAWPMVIKLLEECVSVEEQTALRSKPEDAIANVMRAQGARMLMNRFVAQATETEEADGGTDANG